MIVKMANVLGVVLIGLVALASADHNDTAANDTTTPTSPTTPATVEEAAKTKRPGKPSTRHNKQNFAHQQQQQAMSVGKPMYLAQLSGQEETGAAAQQQQDTTTQPAPVADVTTSAKPTVTTTTPPPKDGTTVKPTNNTGNGTTDGKAVPSEQAQVQKSDSDVRLQDQIYILSGVFGALGLIQFIILISLAVALSSVNSKLRHLQLEIKPSFGTINRGYMQPEVEMAGIGQAGLDDVETRYHQHSPSGNRDYNGYGASPTGLGMSGQQRPPNFPRPHWVGDRASRNYS